MKQWNVIAGLTIVLVLIYAGALTAALFLNIDPAKIDAFKVSYGVPLVAILGYLGGMLKGQ